MLNPFSRKNKTPTLKEAGAPTPDTLRSRGVGEATKTEAAPEKATKAKSMNWPVGIVVAPRLTEKSTGLSAIHQYVFEVADKVNAFMVKDAVQKKYGVKVKRVNMLKSPGKYVRLGRQTGWRKGFKKAVVTLSKGQSIEFT